MFAMWLYFGYGSNDYACPIDMLLISWEFSIYVPNTGKKNSI